MPLFNRQSPMAPSIHTSIMQSLRHIILTSILLLLLVGCHKDENPLTRETRTVLVYMNAENPLVGYSAYDIQEMMAGASQMENGDHLIIYIDDLNAPRIYELDKTNTVLSYSKLEPKYRFDSDLNSSDPETLNRVMQYVTSRHPADSYGIVFWSHGSAWLFDSNETTQAKQREDSRRRSFGLDTQLNNTQPRGYKMYIPDMAEVLSRYPGIEYIMFDACFMQSIEVAYELRHCANYIIGSPAEILATGAPYNYILKHLFANPFSPSNLINEYGDYYESTSDYGVVLSAIKTEAFDQYVETMRQLMPKYSWRDTDFFGCLKYYEYEWNNNLGVVVNMPDFFDIQGVMMRVLSTDDYARWQASYTQLNIASYATNYWLTVIGPTGKGAVMKVNHEQCSGVCMYLPLNCYQDETFYNDYEKTQWGQLFNIQ